MLVQLNDGKCRSCGGQLEITGADDATMDVECTECGDDYTVEPDAFNDGGKPTVLEYEADSELRDTEQIPLMEDGGIEAFIRREVLPHVPDA